MEHDVYIGIDLGATKTLGVVLRNSSVISTLRQKTPKHGLASFVVGFIKKLKEKRNIEGIGLAVPGVLNEEKTGLVFSNNLRAIEKINLKELIEKEFKVKAKIENDANCFTWGEFLYGAGKPFKNIAGVTLGSGIGGGLVINGKLFLGTSGTSSELGHNILKAGGAKCSCGNRGCFEQYGSAQFFLRQTGKNPKTFYKKAKEGNQNALKIWNIYGYWVGLGLADIANILDPEAIIVGGGITQAWQFFSEKMERTFRKTILSPISSKKIKLLRAELGQKGGAIGAASLFL